jgi:cytochrome c biogenesis protein CcmG, thiol:disulfide interchange protein DsbE
MTRTTLIACIAIAALGCNQRREAPAPGTATTSTTMSTTAPVATQTAPLTVTVGEPMPPYTAKLLDGSDYDVASERGNVVMLNLWATWCGPCRYEIPELEKLHKDHAAERFKVVGVSVDEGGAQVVKDFVDEQKMTYPVVLDPESRLAIMIDTTVLPTTILLDRQGKVVWKKIGIVTMGDVEMLSAIEKALKS